MSSFCNFSHFASPDWAAPHLPLNIPVKLSYEKYYRPPVGDERWPTREARHIPCHLPAGSQIAFDPYSKTTRGAQLARRPAEEGPKCTSFPHSSGRLERIRRRW